MMQHGILHIETGAEFSGSRRDKDGEDRQILFPVVFGSRFTGLPEVVLGLSGFEVDIAGNAYRLRCNVLPRQVTQAGFSILLTVPLKSDLLISLEVSWMAFSE